jgi:hypothetical protein
MLANNWIEPESTMFDQCTKPKVAKWPARSIGVDMMVGGGNRTRS